jgi:hypothetical protein
MSVSGDGVAYGKANKRVSGCQSKVGKSVPPTRRALVDAVEQVGQARRAEKREDPGKKSFLDDLDGFEI